MAKSVLKASGRKRSQKDDSPKVTSLMDLQFGSSEPKQKATKAPKAPKVTKDTDRAHPGPGGKVDHGQSLMDLQFEGGGPNFSYRYEG